MSFQAYCPYCEKKVTAFAIDDDEVMHTTTDEKVGDHRWKLNKYERENLPKVRE